MQGLPQLPLSPFHQSEPQRQVTPPSALPSLPARSTALQCAAAPGPTARVTFFLLPLGREQIPVWVFVPAHLAQGIAALVLHLGEQGLQVFTPPGVDWGTGPMRLHLLEAAQGSHATHPQSVRVQRLWRRTISHSGDLHGLVFLEAEGPAETTLRHHHPEPLARNWMRCVLERLPAQGQQPADAGAPLIPLR